MKSYNNVRVYKANLVRKDGQSRVVYIVQIDENDMIIAEHGMHVNLKDIAEQVKRVIIREEAQNPLLVYSIDFEPFHRMIHLKGGKYLLCDPLSKAEEDEFLEYYIS